MSFIRLSRTFYVAISRRLTTLSRVHLDVSVRLITVIQRPSEDVRRTEIAHYEGYARPLTTTCSQRLLVRPNRAKFHNH